MYTQPFPQKYSSSEMSCLNENVCNACVYCEQVWRWGNILDFFQVQILPVEQLCLNSVFILVRVLNIVSDSVKKANFLVDFSTSRKPTSENLRDALNSFSGKFNVLTWMKNQILNSTLWATSIWHCIFILKLCSVKLEQFHHQLCGKISKRSRSLIFTSQSLDHRLCCPTEAGSPVLSDSDADAS